MKNKIIKFGLVVFALALTGFAAYSVMYPAQTHADSGLQSISENIIVKKANGEEFVFSVEIADSAAAHKRGLMHRTYLDKNHGMLFLFNDTARRSFWMKNTLIPLDIIFLRKDGEIHHIHSMAKPLDETRITALEGSKAVLEINGGLSDKMGLKTGDKIYHNAFQNMNLLAE